MILRRFSIHSGQIGTVALSKVKFGRPMIGTGGSLRPTMEKLALHPKLALPFIFIICLYLNVNVFTIGFGRVRFFIFWRWIGCGGPTPHWQPNVGLAMARWKIGFAFHFFCFGVSG